MTFRDSSAACSGFEVTVYESTRWVELNPTADLASGSTSLALSGLTNSPYVLSSGISFSLQLWLDGHFLKEFSYQATPAASPHLVLSKQLSPMAVTISQQTKYTIQFKTSNGVPKEDIMVIELP